MENVSTVTVGTVLRDPENKKVGTITDVISDPNTLRPTWYNVKMGLFGGGHLVPAGKVAAQSDHLVVPYSKDQIKAAPHISGAVPLAAEEEDLYRHYHWSP